MAVSAYTALYGLPASVQKIVDPDTGAVSLQFAIPKGEAFGYDDFTAEQLEALKGDPGDTTPAIDNLTSTDTDAALSANQGRVLNEALADKINATFETLSFNDDLNSIMPDGKHERYVANQYCDNIPYGSFGGFVDVCGANTSGGYRCTQTFVDAIDGTTYTRGSAHNIWTEWAEHATFNECMVGYAVCTVTANVAAKIVSIEGFKVTTGAHISVLFTEGNTAHNATLNINATGAKPIWLNGVSVDTCSIYAGAVLELVYDGAHYVIVGGVQSTPSDVKFQWEEVCELVFTNDSASVAFPSDVNFYGAATFLAVPDFTSSFPASYSFGPDSTHDDALSTNWTLVHCPFKAPIAVQNDGVDIGLQGSTCLSLSYGATNATSGYCTLDIATTGSIKIYLEKIAT